jgi:serine/threonine-protein kinase
MAAADRNLLLGILALQMDFVSRDALIAAMHAWALDKAKPLGLILCERGALTAAERAPLEALVDRHLARHDHDPDKSLAALRPSPEVCADLGSIPGSELLSALSPTPDGPPTVSVEASPPLSTDGRYQRLRPHARGGLGEVWVAADRELEREVALKEIQEQHAAQADNRARFLLEARVTGGLEHPGIVPVYGLGHHPDGRPYYAMRLIKGDSLRRAIEGFYQTNWHGKPGEKALAFRNLLGRFIDVCDAVEYAHSRGVLHRDLKPGNVMLGKYGETLVVDWGLAKVTGRADVEATEGGLTVSSGDSGLTQAGKALGTPAYMSPEQAAGRLDELGPRSDVYSLGATLYTLLTNQTPFPQGEIGDVLSRVERGDFPAPRQVNKEVPRPLEAVCLKAMARDSRERYGSPRSLAGDVEHWLADEPVSAYREPWAGRARRWLKRYRAAAIGAVAVLVVAAASLAVATALLSAKNDELTRANSNEQAAKLQEQVAREQAQKNFQMAFQAVEDYLTGVADNDRLREKDLEPLRKDLMRSAQAFYRRFAEQERDSPKYRSLAAQADIALGQIHDQLGEREQAKAHYDKAVSALRELAAAESGQFPHQERLVRATLGLADLLRRQKDFVAAESWAREGLRLSGQLRNDFPGENAARELEASAYFTLGEVLAERPRLPEAEGEYLAALLLQEGLAGEAGGWRRKLPLLKGYAFLGYLYVSKMNRLADGEKVYRKALEVLDRLEEGARKQPAVRGHLADCQRGLANTLLYTAQPGEAEELFRAAVRTQASLVADFPMVPSHREQLSTLFNDLSRCLLARGRYPENLEVARRWAEAMERLTRDFPGIPVYRNLLASAYYTLGQAQHKVGDKEEGVRQRRRSVEVMAALMKEHPEVPEYRMRLSVFHNGLGFALMELGHMEESRAESAEALAVIHPLAAQNPGVPQYQLYYGQALFNYGNALERAQKKEEALAHIREATAVLERLTRSTDNLEHRMWLGGAYAGLAKTLHAGGNAPEARQAADQAVATLEELFLRDAKFAAASQHLRQAHQVRAQLLAGFDLGAAEVRNGQRALSLAHAGKFNDAFKEANALAEGKDLSAEGCYTLARVYARLLQARKKDDAKGRDLDATRAVAMLRRARKAGFFKEAARSERLRREPDLATLRDRAEFKQLLDQLPAGR